MPPATAQPGKSLGEFLKEQQEPFILELYLSERGYTKKLKTPNGGSAKSSETFTIGSVLNKKRDTLLPFSKVLTSLQKKLAFHNHSCIVIRDIDIINEHQHVNVSVGVDPHYEVVSTDQTTVETERFSFSTTTSSTVYYSCSDFDEDHRISLSSPYKDNSLFSPNTCQASRVNNMGVVVQSQQANNNEKHQQRCLEGSCSVPDPQSQNISGMEGRTSNWGVAKKITRDSLLSSALWSSVIESSCSSKELQEVFGPNEDVYHVLKSKTLVHKAKKLLFDCLREITVNVYRKQMRGSEGLWERNKEGGNVSLDDEWSEFKPQVKHICVQIANAILERVTNEIVSEMI